MTHEQIDLIRTSWKEIKPIAGKAGELFYAKLFETAPGLRKLFAPDIHPQANKLMQVLDYVVEHLDDIESLLPGIRELGHRHAGYGAKPSHYEFVGLCLIETLKECLKGSWTPEMKDAWTTAYYRIKQVMIVAQENHVSGIS